MQATEMLKAEHGVIERVLDLLTKAVERVEAGQSLPEGFAPWSVEFVRHFADHCHHGKEEDVLFPLLEQRGIPRQGGPVGVMLAEHEQGRDCVRRMDEAAQQHDHAAFAKAAAEYVALLEQHITKENTVLFPMADRCISDEDDAKLVEQFEAVEREKGGHELHGKFEADIEQWRESLSKE